MKSNVYKKLFAIALPSYAGNACEVKSGIAVQAVAELYTSKVVRFKQRDWDAHR